ncbi:MAG: GxxExxY protein [Alphaproteobacteria bacterium]|nr:GxxExxY protein [Alphaproteobacteria bacterium]
MQQPLPERVEHLASVVIDAGLLVHRTLGPGLLESVYEQCLAHELKTRKITVDRQVTLPIIYRDHKIDAALRIDLVVEHVMILEIKSVETVLPIHSSQLLTYLKLSGYRLGFLMNFNVPLFKDGIRRVIV